MSDGVPPVGPVHLCSGHARFGAASRLWQNRLRNPFPGVCKGWVRRVDKSFVLNGSNGMCKRLPMKTTQKSTLSLLPALFAVLFALVATKAIAQASLPTTVTVSTSGNGYVSPNLFGQTLKIGKTYSLTAISDFGAVFSNWSGDITSAKNPLTFVFRSNMVLQANFIFNPFYFWEGT